MDEIIIAIIIFGVACIIATLFAMRKKWRMDLGTGDDPIEHYTEKRDEVSIPEDDEDDNSFNATTTAIDSVGFNPIKLISNLLGAGIVIYVGILLWNNIKPVLDDSMSAMNTTGIETTAINGTLQFMPIIGIVLFVFIFGNAIMSAFRNTYEYDEDDEELPKKKQPRKKGIAHYTAARDKMSKRKK